MGGEELIDVDGIVLAAAEIVLVVEGEDHRRDERDRGGSADAPPDPADPDVAFGVAPEQITTELLGLCAEFFRQASPMAHTELGQFLTEHGHPAASAGSSAPLDSPQSTAPSVPSR